MYVYIYIYMYTLQLRGKIPKRVEQIKFLGKWYHEKEELCSLYNLCLKQKRIAALGEKKNRFRLNSMGTKAC